jgi:hypothetical protein
MKFSKSSNHLGSFASDPVFGIAGNTYWNTDLTALKIYNGTSWGLFSSGGGGGDLELGETSTTAYRGDRGKTAYDHSQATHDKSFVGLANVDNTSDANKPVSTAQQTALDLKANIASPNFTGTPLAPTASVNTNTTQIATTAFVIAEVLARLASNDAMLYKGTIDCSTNPNYPASDAGHTYRVSVAGKIGGASGPNVEVGDRITCNSDGTSAGTHGSVGSNWDILQINIDGAVTGQASSVEDELALFSGSSGKIIKRASSSGIALLTSGVLSVLGSSGSGNVARVNSPTFVTPTLGVASATELSVGDDAYGVGWNGSTNVPTKNAVYDKIESMGGGGGSSYDESNPILDSSSNEVFQFFKTTSAVNHLAATNNSTGNAPILSAVGSDTNIALTIASKGTAPVIIDPTSYSNGLTGFKIFPAGSGNSGLFLASGFEGASTNAIYWQLQSYSALINLWADNANARGGIGYNRLSNSTTAAGAELLVSASEITGRIANGSTLFSAFKADIPASATHTALFIYDYDNATLERVTVGAADSGGSGFKVLRIPN